MAGSTAVPVSSLQLFCKIQVVNKDYGWLFVSFLCWTIRSFPKDDRLHKMIVWYMICVLVYSWKWYVSFPFVSYIWHQLNDCKSELCWLHSLVCLVELYQYEYVKLFTTCSTCWRSCWSTSVNKCPLSVGQQNDFLRHYNFSFWYALHCIRSG